MNRLARSAYENTTQPISHFFTIMKTPWFEWSGHRKGLESKSWNRAGTKSRIGAENRNRNGKKDLSSLLRAPSANTRLRTMTLQYWGSLHKPSYHLPRIEIHVPWKNEDRKMEFRPEKFHFGTSFLRGKEDVNVSYIMTDDVEGTSRFQAPFYLFLLISSLLRILWLDYRDFETDFRADFLRVHLLHRCNEGSESAQACNSIKIRERGSQRRFDQILEQVLVKNSGISLQGSEGITAQQLEWKETKLQSELLFFSLPARWSRF